MEGAYAHLALDVSAFRLQLRAKSRTIELPLPSGKFASFTTEESSVFGPVLAAKYPELTSYRVEGPWGPGRVAISHKGVDALLPGPDGTYAIQPGETDVDHLVFYSRSYSGEEVALPLSCGYNPDDPLNHTDLQAAGHAGAKGLTKSGGDARELRRYDLAMTNTGEFAQAVGGTTKDVLAAFNTSLTVLNAIFEPEVGVNLRLLDLSEGLIYLDPTTDPFTDADKGTGLLGQVIEAFNLNDIPASAYDLGHVFTKRCVDVGGVVSGLACSGSKTRGVTCLQSNNVARTAERIMAHEIAHQFSVSHSWNNCPPSMEQRAGSTAYEPGSGSTIMSYAGACGDQNIGGFDAYYHTASLEQFLDFTRTGGAAGCATVIETDNVTPDVTLDYADGFYIPRNTPFRLTGTATDANDPQEQLTFNWEEYDLGPATKLYEAEGNAPIFRSVVPTADGFTRYFPRVDRVANQIDAKDELLPDYERELTFRLTARDNNTQAGGVDWEAVTFNVADIGPFTVNDPLQDGDSTWQVGDYREVTWDVAGTDGFPVFAETVNILLSGDGGLTFDRVLVANAANTGSAFVTVPDSLGDAMRIVVEAAGNIFYHMNGSDFSIEAATVPGYTLDYDLHYANICLPETVTATFTVGSILAFDRPVTLSVDADSLPANLVASFDRTQLIPGQTTTLTLNLEEVNVSGRYTIPVTVAAEGLDTSRREIVLDVIANDFSDLSLQGPAEGTEGIQLTTTFDWSGSVNADGYEVQIATSPDFSEASLFAAQSGLTETTFTPEEFFAPNLIYFWRVRPVNACGAGGWTETASFHTVSSRCDTYESTDTPVSLPGTGGSFTRESKLFVDRRGTINDLNLPNVQVNYQFASKVSLTLTSPAGTAVRLYAEKCFSTNSINLGFDDQAPDEVACPPDDQRVFRPLDSLSAFNGEDTFGEWVLSVAVSETNGAAGQIVKWDVEFCADASAPTPETLVNDTTLVQPLGRNPVVRAELEIRSGEDSPEATYFVLTRLPAHGLLERDGRTLVLGDTFTQSDINDQLLIYENLDTVRMKDDFKFVVTTESGGYLPVTSHGIGISADATNPVRPPAALVTGLSLFPNPTAGDLQLRWSATTTGTVSVELYDMTGRQVTEQPVSLASGEATLDTAGLPAGIYLLRIGDQVRRVIRR